MLSPDDEVDKMPVFGSWMHPGVLVDLLVFKVGIGNIQLVFCPDG